MSKLSKEDILKLARLSRLELTAQEVTQFSEEISAILQYVEQLKTVDLTDEEPTYQVTGLKDVTRPDEIIVYQATPEDILKSAPAIEASQYKVKRMVK